MFDDAVSFPMLGFMERLSTIAKGNEISIFEAWELYQSIAVWDGNKAIVKISPDRFDPVVKRVTKEQELNEFIDWLFAVVPARRKAILEQAGVADDDDFWFLKAVGDAVEVIAAPGCIERGECREYREYNFTATTVGEIKQRRFPDRLKIVDADVVKALQHAPHKICLAHRWLGKRWLFALALVSLAVPEAEYVIYRGVPLDD